MKKILAGILALFLICGSASAEGYSLLTEETYFMAGTFLCGMAHVVEGSREAIIDKDGNFILPFDERAKCIRKNGLIMVMGENGMAGFFDKTGTQLTDFIYDTYADTHEKTRKTTAHYFHNRFDGDGKSDLVPISRNKKFGFINSRGEEQIPPIYPYVYGFCDGVARVCSGSEVTEYGTYINCKYGLLRADGSVIIPEDTYWILHDFQYGFAIGGNAKGQMVDKNGKIRDLGGYLFRETNGIYILAENEEGLTAVLDMNGKIILPLSASVKELCGELILVDGTALINRHAKAVQNAPEGGRLHRIWEEENSPFIRVTVQDKGQNRYGISLLDGTVILPPVYAYTKVLGEGLLYAHTDTAHYLFDYSGTLICTLNGTSPEVCRAGRFVMRDAATNRYVYVKNPLRDITVLYNETPLVFSDVPPLLENGRTLVPLRVIFEAMGAEVWWEDSIKTVFAKRGDTEIILPVGAPAFSKNGEKIALDVPAKIENGRTLVPLRAIADAFGEAAEWEGETRTVRITA